MTLYLYISLIFHAYKILFPIFFKLCKEEMSNLELQNLQAFLSSTKNFENMY